MADLPHTLEIERQVSTKVARAYGPSALGGEARRFIELTMTLARTEFKLRYYGSLLGYIWSLVRPLLFFGVIYVFFVKIIQIAEGPHYGVYLLTGIVLWNYFSEATGNCVNCLVAREAMLRKMRFPATRGSDVGIPHGGVQPRDELLVVLVFALPNGIGPSDELAGADPDNVLGYMLFATGFGMLLSPLYVRYRDMRRSGRCAFRRGSTPPRHVPATE